MRGGGDTDTRTYTRLSTCLLHVLGTTTVAEHGSMLGVEDAPTPALPYDTVVSHAACIAWLPGMSDEPSRGIYISV